MNLLKISNLYTLVRYSCPKRYLSEIASVEKKLQFEESKDPQSKNKVDANTIALLERLSLVDCMSKEEIKTLEASIDFADQIFEVDTTNIEPMVTVLEDYPLRVKEDQITEGNYKEDILKNAALTEEDYFVAPPGNIPIENRQDLLYESNTKDTR